MCTADSMILLLGLGLLVGAAGTRPPFSFDTLPVFFHSANTSGEWSDAAVKQIARYAMATNEKSHAMLLPDGGRQSEELAGPAACRQIAAEGTGTASFFYLNSVIDWPFNFKLHSQMQANSSWRLKNVTGGDLGPAGSGGAFPGNNWGYNLTNNDMRSAWVQTCVAAVRAGCTGCFVDQANVQEHLATWGPSPQDAPVAMSYRAAHLKALSELDAALAPLGGYGIYNHLGTTRYGTATMMIEDFVGSERCIETLQNVAARGLTVQAHAGNYPAGNTCVDGDTNSLAAFLIAAGNYSYYHCAGVWSSDARWPAVQDAWLDWLPQYDWPLGAPSGPAAKRPSAANASASVWSRSFASGTRVEFDGGLANGTIYWANGVVQMGQPANLAAIARGCVWESL